MKIMKVCIARRLIRRNSNEKKKNLINNYDSSNVRYYTRRLWQQFR